MPGSDFAYVRYESESVYFAHTLRRVFAWRGPYKPLCCCFALVSFVSQQSSVPIVAVNSDPDILIKSAQPNLLKQISNIRLTLILFFATNVGVLFFIRTKWKADIMQGQNSSV